MTAKPETRSPFELLVSQAQRASAGALAAQQQADNEWTGLLCRLGKDKVLMPMSMLKEIVPPAEVTPVPGTRSWLKGLANMHGSLVTVVDLQEFLLGEPLPRTEKQARMLVVSEAGQKVGLLVNEVFGMRHFRVGDEVRETPAFDPALKPYITAALKRQGDHYSVFNLQRLLSSSAFQDAAL